MLGPRCCCLLLAMGIAASGADSSSLDAKQAKSIVLAQRVAGQVGKSLDFRVVQTDRSVNYKLRATWMTPEVIRANARLQQLARALPEVQANHLVEEAEQAGAVVILVELDPREGSGVIPGDWMALLGSREQRSGAMRQVAGVSNPKLRDVAALSAVQPRDYSYELFWLVFPLTDSNGQPLFTAEDKEAELTVRIQNRSGKVHWPLPEYVRSKLAK